jgi:hypothetical protein
MGFIFPYAYGNGRKYIGFEDGRQFRFFVFGCFAAVLFQRYRFSIIICEINGRFIAFSPSPLKHTVLL